MGSKEKNRPREIVNLSKVSKKEGIRIFRIVIQQLITLIEHSSLKEGRPVHKLNSPLDLCTFIMPSILPLPIAKSKIYTLCMYQFIRHHIMHHEPQ